MELTIQVVGGASERLALHVAGGPETSVLELKQLIELQNTVRFPVAAQRLIFQGQILQNEKLLGEYNIADGMALHLTLAPSVAASIAAAAAAAPQGPSNVRAAFASMPPSNRTPSPATLMRQYLQQMQGENGFETAIQTLQKICDNIISHPSEEKYRKLRVGNAALKARLFDRSRGMDCVRLLGFQEGVEEGHVVLVPTAERWETMTTLKRVIDEFASMPSPSTMFGGSPAAAFPNAFGAGAPGMGGGNDFANMAAQASAMLQNPMMAQAISSHPMMQQMAQANPMIAQALQNPVLLQQMLQSMQQNPAMMQQVSQMMQDPNAMQQMQQMMGGGLGMGATGMGFPSFPGAPAAAPAASNPFATPAASNPFAAAPTGPSNPFAAFATPPTPASAVSSARATASATTSSSSATPAAAAASASSGDEIFDEEDIAAAIARSLEEH